ncbi:ribonuclease Z [Cohnella cellulosilytica]|uniref:Ribonuclease Z n=1 Tax=Cohnella cellulosilytica TaxID=986710 RepID=A0ABW2FH60_9BACL
MELWFMGTSAGMPIAERNVTSVALNLTRPKGTFWLFDCGEGTQHRLLQSPLKLSRLTKLFITHLHGDHLFGVPGLLSSRSSLGGVEPLDVYGPPGLREFIDTALRLSGTHLDYPLNVREIEEEGLVLDGEGYTVECAPLDHRIFCLGYRVAEKPRAGALCVDVLAAAGVPPGPAYGRLKAGEDLVLEDGRIVRAADVLCDPIPGRVVAVMGDTRPCEGAVRLARGADALVYEATFGADLAEKAELYGHSTSVQAAEIARAAGASRLLMTHFSSRYGREDLALLEEQARSVFPRSDAALELEPYAVPTPPRRGR